MFLSNSFYLKKIKNKTPSQLLYKINIVSESWVQDSFDIFYN